MNKFHLLNEISIFHTNLQQFQGLKIQDKAEDIKYKHIGPVQCKNEYPNKQISALLFLEKELV